jgi:hypothetical protein
MALRRTTRLVLVAAGSHAAVIERGGACHGSEFHHATVINTDFIKRLFYGAALDLSPSA